MNLKSAAEIAGQFKTSRESRLERILREMAAARLAEVRHVDLKVRIDVGNRGKERVADEFSARVGPWQVRVKEIDKLQVDAMLAGEQPNAELEAERRELIDKINTAKDEMKAAIDEADKRLALLEDERREIAKQCNMSTLMTDLLESASPEQLTRLRQARLRHIAATEREVFEQIRNELLQASGL